MRGAAALLLLLSLGEVRACQTPDTCLTSLMLAISCFGCVEEGK